MKNMKKLALLIVCALVTDIVYGAGFALYEYSGRSTAMGGAVMANEAEPASLASNPSLITELEGTQVQVGATLVTAHAKTTVNGDSRTLKKDVWTLPNFYLTHKWSDDISFGLGGFSRYGLGGTYKNWENWEGRDMAYKVKLETFSFTPTIAVKANDEFSVAMGLEAMTIDFTQNAVVNKAYPFTYEIHGTGVSWGGNFSFIYRPEWAEKWSLGATYRSKVKQNLNGYIHNSTGADIGTLYNANAKGAITLPDSVSTGVAFRATDNWVMEAGIVGTFWSSYDQITIEYKDHESAPSIRNRKEYKDTYRLNFGTEYKLNDNWAVRAGYVFDKSPINAYAMDTLVPVDDRHIGSVGFGYKTETWNVDFAYAHIFARDLSGDSHYQSGDRPMKYSDGRSDMYALTFGYKF